MRERDELADILHGKGAYCGSCGYEGGNCSDCTEVLGGYADAILAAGYRKPRVITTAEELDALPDDSLVLASGRYFDGSGDFTDCWIRPIPDHITGGTGARLWEALIYLDGGVHNMTRNDCITLPVTVLCEGDNS